MSRPTGADAELGDQGSNAILARPDPLSADFHYVSAPNRHVEGTPADALPRLEHEKRVYPAPLELAACHQTREPSADDDHVHVPQSGMHVIARCGANQTGRSERCRRRGASTQPHESPATEAVTHRAVHPFPYANQVTMTRRSSTGTASITSCMTASASPRVLAATSASRRLR